MMQVTEHIWWMPPAKPDRPSVCAVVGDRWTLMLDAGSSRAHTRAFLDELPARPSAVLYTHSHWDHVFGGVEVGGLVIAHRRTVPKLTDLAARDWSDEGLADYAYAADIQEELPSPRVVEIAAADIVFDEQIDFDLGGVTVHARHVESDHCDDACIAYVAPDRLLFLGDALCGGAGDKLTAAVALPLFETVLAYDAEHFVEGHHPSVATRAEIEELIAKGRAAERGIAPADDEEAQWYLEAFVH